MSDIAVIGNREIVAIFKLFGFKVYFLEEKGILKEMVDLALKEGNLVLFIQEDLLKDNENVLSSYMDKIYPLLMPIGVYRRDTGLIKKILSTISLKAIGKPLD